MLLKHNHLFIFIFFILNIQAQLTAQTCSCERQLLYNNSFETGTTTGWSSTNGNLYVWGGGGADGTYYAGVNYNDKVGGYDLYQDWNNVIAGRTYNFNGSFTTHDGTKYSIIQLLFFDASNNPIGITYEQEINTKYPTWTPVTWSAVAPAGAVRVRVRGYTENTALKMDGIKLETCFVPVVSVTFANSATNCVNSTVHLTSVMTDPSVSVTYQWQKSTDSTIWVNISGATNANRTETNVVGKVYYRLKAVSSSCTVYSSVMVVASYDTTPPILSGVPGNTTVSCENIPTAANPTATDNCGLENIVFQETNSSCSNPLLNVNSGIENVANVAMDTTFQGYPAKKLPNYSTALTGWEMGFPATAITPALLVNDNTNTINNPNGNYFIWVPSNSYCVLNNPVSLQAGQCVEISLWAASFSNAAPQQATRIQVEVFRVSDNQTFEPYSQVLPASTSVTTMNWQRIVTKFVTPTAGAYKFVVTQEVDPVYGPTPKGFALDGFELKNCCETAPSGCKSYTITRTWTARDKTGNATKQSQIITVTDTKAPILNNVPANITVCETVPAAAALTATDNCDATPSVFLTSEVSTKTNNGTCTDNFYTVTRTWTAKDNCDNTAIAQQIITVLGSFKPVITASPFCAGGSTTLSATLLTCIASATYQWQLYNGTAWVSVGSGATYTTGSISGNQTYRVFVTVAGSSCTGMADDFVATPAPAFNVTVTTPSATICVNSTSFLTAKVTGGAGTFTYQWQRNSNNGSTGWTNIAGATDANFPIQIGRAHV